MTCLTLRGAFAARVDYMPVFNPVAINWGKPSDEAK
jgi:hypothetical protein